MAEKKNDLMEWLGFANPPKFVNAPWFGKILGFLISVLCLVVAGLLLLIIAKFTAAAVSGDFTESGDGARALRELGTVILALFGAPFLIWRTVIASKQAHTAEQGLYTDRIAKAVEQIGADKVVKRQRTDENGNLTYERDSEGNKLFSKPAIIEETVPNLEVRIGGLYALERIARDSSEDRITVMEILCAYIRENCKPDTSCLPADDASWEEWLKWDTDSRPEMRSDVNAAISVINHRGKVQQEFERAHGFILDLNGVDFRGLNIDLKSFSHSNFKNAKLQGASITDSDIQDSAFIGTKLIGARFFNTNLSGSAFLGCRFDFAAFGRAKLNSTIYSACHFPHTSFAETKLRGAEFSGFCYWNNITNFRNADLTGTSFHHMQMLHSRNRSKPVEMLSQSQMLSCFGDTTVKFTERADQTSLCPLPSNWAETDIPFEDFHSKWRAFQKSIGFDPENPEGGA